MDSAGDPLVQLLVEVFREQRSALWGFFARGPAPPGGVEDLVQETFLRAWDHRDAIASAAGPPDREGIRRYLWRIARNLVIDQVRWRHRRGDPVELQEPPGADPGPAERVELEDCMRVLRDTLRGLPRGGGRRCLELWLDEKDLEAIAGELKLGINQARGLLQRARDELVERAARRLLVERSGRSGGKGRTG